MEKIFKKIQNAAEKEMSCTAHGIDHVLRVYNLALHLAENEDVDLDVLKAAVLLHDIARAKEDSDSTGRTDHALLGAELCVPILKKVDFPNEKISRVQECIASHRSRSENDQKTIEAKILFDADKLDGLGAIGMARAFIWVGENGAQMYRDIDAETYAKENLGGKLNGRIRDKTRHSPQLEYKTRTIFIIEKLHTAQAKKIGKERLAYLENFLKRLEREIKGEL